MPNYGITVQHHSLARSREVKVNGTLRLATRRASQEFSSEQREYTIQIHELSDEREPQLVASRRVSQRYWTYA
jgi:hypothetical protein